MACWIITGASRGIGLALCRRLVERGDEIVGVCREVSSGLDALGVQTVAGIDVARPECARRLGEALAGVAVDVLVNNAGINSNQSLGSIDDAGVEAMLDLYRVNAIGPLLITQALLGNLGRGAKVAFVTSRMGSVADNASGGAYGYRMSKAALNMAGASLARDLAPREVAVALLHPGWVRTGMTHGRGQLDAAEAAAGLVARIDALDLAASGGFWHASGEKLPW